MSRLDCENLFLLRYSMLYCLVLYRLLQILRLDTRSQSVRLLIWLFYYFVLGSLVLISRSPAGYVSVLFSGSRIQSRRQIPASSRRHGFV